MLSNNETIGPMIPIQQEWLQNYQILLLKKTIKNGDISPLTLPGHSADMQSSVSVESPGHFSPELLPLHPRALILNPSPQDEVH